MLVILAHPRDSAARGLVARWRPRDVCVMTARDLSHPGWSHHVGGRGDDWCVASGQRLRSSSLQAVITRIPAVAPTDLVHIAEADREYVAAEMTACLTSWLTRLRCPVLNRPDATSLMGPNRGRERWALLAARAGLRVAQRVHHAPATERVLASANVTVVGRRWIGDVAPELGAQAVRLADRVGVDLLTVQFDTRASDAAFVCAEPMIDVAIDAVADALLEHVDAGVVA